MPLQFRPAGSVPATPTLRLRDATLRDLVQNRDGKELGHATFGITWKGPRPKDAGRLTSLDVTFTLRIEMPVWTRYSSRPEAERHEWDRFYRALLVHERGRIAIFRREAPTTDRRLVAATEATIKNVTKQETQRIHRVSAAYDRRTDYGRRQKSTHGTTVIVVPPNTTP